MIPKEEILGRLGFGELKMKWKDFKNMEIWKTLCNVENILKSIFIYLPGLEISIEDFEKETNSKEMMKLKKDREYHLEESNSWNKDGFWEGVDWVHKAMKRVRKEEVKETEKEKE